jgi:ubiquinone/menaquinone biosynthesis C-methylase UbiE
MAIPARIPETEAMHAGEQLDLDRYSASARKFIGGEYRKLNEVLIGELGLQPRGRVLEIGPGPGWIGIWLARRLPGIEVVGLELSPDMIHVAERNRAAEGAGNVRFELGDAADLSRFGDASFDGVVSNGSLHHWLDPVAVLSGIARVLKPGGAVAINDNRRDLALPARLLVAVIRAAMRLDPKASGALRAGWKTSIAAAYTAAEVRGLLQRSTLRGCSVREGALDLLIATER